MKYFNSRKISNKKKNQYGIKQRGGGLFDICFTSTCKRKRREKERRKKKLESACHGRQVESCEADQDAEDFVGATELGTYWKWLIGFEPTEQDIKNNELIVPYNIQKKIVNGKVNKENIRLLPQEIEKIKQANPEKQISEDSYFKGDNQFTDYGIFYFGVDTGKKGKNCNKPKKASIFNPIGFLKYQINSGINTVTKDLQKNIASSIGSDNMDDPVIKNQQEAINSDIHKTVNTSITTGVTTAITSIPIPFIPQIFSLSVWYNLLKDNVCEILCKINNMKTTIIKTIDINAELQIEKNPKKRKSILKTAELKKNALDSFSFEEISDLILNLFRKPFKENNVAFVIDIPISIAKKILNIMQYFFELENPFKNICRDKICIYKDVPMNKILCNELRSNNCNETFSGSTSKQQSIPIKDTDRQKSTNSYQREEKTGILGSVKDRLGSGASSLDSMKESGNNLFSKASNSISGLKESGLKFKLLSPEEINQLEKDKILNIDGNNDINTSPDDDAKIGGSKKRLLKGGESLCDKINKDKNNFKLTEQEISKIFEKKPNKDEVIKITCNSTQTGEGQQEYYYKVDLSIFSFLSEKQKKISEELRLKANEYFANNNLKNKIFENINLYVNILLSNKKVIKKELSKEQSRDLKNKVLEFFKKIYNVILDQIRVSTFSKINLTNFSKLIMSNFKSLTNDLNFISIEEFSKIILIIFFVFINIILFSTAAAAVFLSPILFPILWLFMTLFESTIDKFSEFKNLIPLTLINTPNEFKQVYDKIKKEFLTPIQPDVSGGTKRLSKKIRRFSNKNNNYKKIKIKKSIKKSIQNSSKKRKRKYLFPVIKRRSMKRKSMKRIRR